MKVEYQNAGVISTVSITSTVFEFRKHNRAVDAALIMAPGTIAKRRGVFFMKSIISGKARDVLRAYRVAVREVAR
jgi:hypothetical protein